MYNKLFSKILDSSIWLAPDSTRLVWITLLAAMDEDGFVSLATVANVARRANVSESAAHDAMLFLESPDPATPECPYAGRRIERVEGGWMVLKAKEYASIVRRVEMLALNRERVRRSRERAKSRRDTVTNGNAQVTERSGNGVTQAQDDQACNGAVMQSYLDTDVRTLPNGRESSEDDADFAPKALMAVWNETTTPPLPKCLSLSKGRRLKAKTRLLEHGPNWWQTVVARINASRFCRGENDRGWVATFDWLIANQENALKVLEGKYDDRVPVLPVRADGPSAQTLADEVRQKLARGGVSGLRK